MVDLTKFKAGLEAAFNSMPTACADPKGAFSNLLHQKGYKAPKTIQIGQIERIDGPNDKPGKKSGWYVFNEIADTAHDGYVIGIASYGDWKTGEQDTWCSKSDHHMSIDERMRYHAARDAMRAEAEAERNRGYAEAAILAYNIWQDAQNATSHAYLAKKQVNASDGLKIANDGRLIIPISDDKGQIISLQFISDDGQKKFLTRGRTKGGVFLIDGNKDTIYVCEGYATGKSINMATDNACYVGFNAGNLFEAVSIAKSCYPGARIVVAGDDDINTNGNPGRTKAQQAADAFGVDVVFPIGHIDFNDMAIADGLDSVKKLLKPSVKPYKKPVKTGIEVDLPSGVLSDIIGYYNATAGNKQVGFAIQTALGLCSIILGRGFKTSMENYTSLYLLNVAKSGTGKEHAKTVIERILHEANHGHLIAGDGYTSAGAVFSALLDRPKHISVIDEFGRYLEAGRDMKGGNHHQREANTKLMEAIGRAHSIIRPPAYSTMTLKKDQADAVKNRIVYNPSITLVTMTTPDTLFKTLDMGAIKDGFVNRFIISISEAERSIRQHKPAIEVPQKIINWINEVTARYGKSHISTEPSAAITLEFTSDAMDLQNEFQQYCIDKANYLERFGMAELPGRSNEMAMRISLICALARNPLAESVDESDMQWSINYVKSCLEKTIDCLKVSVSSSEFESFKKEIMKDLRERGEEGITWSAMQKNAPYSKHKQKDLRDILLALKDADLAIDEPYQNGGKGRPTIRWVAV